MLRAVAALLLLVVVGACSAPPAPPTRVVLNPWVGYEPLVLARERGLIDPSALKVIELASHTASTRALRNGLADAAGLTLDEALRLADEGFPIRIVALLDDSNGGDAVLARAGVDSPAALRGKRIALEQTALGSLVLGRLLAAGGLTRQDVTLLQREAGSHAAVIQRGEADAVITFEPIKSQLVASGYTVIFDSRAMPGDIVDVLAVRADLPDVQVGVLLAAWEAGRQALVADPEASADLLAVGLGLTPAQYLSTLGGLRFIAATESAQRLDARALASSAGPLAEHLQGLGLLERPPDWTSLTTGPEAARR